MASIVDYIKRAVGPTIFACGALYFGHYALNGEYGYAALTEARAEQEILARNHASLMSRREAMESRALLLDSQSIDLDMLEERAREVLGYARPDDIIVIR